MTYDDTVIRPKMIILEKIIYIHLATSIWIKYVFSNAVFIQHTKNLLTD